MRTFRGEYWYDGILLTDADIDIGEYGHEQIAESAICYDILSLLPFYYEPESVDGYISDENQLWDDVVEKLYNDGELDDLYEFFGFDNLEDFTEDSLYDLDSKEVLSTYIEQKTNEDTENKQILLDYLTGKYIGDSRQFACQVYGWISVKGNVINCWDFSENTRKKIISAINETANVEGIYEEDISKMEFEIGLYSGIEYFELTYEEILNYGKDGTSSINRGNLNLTDYWNRQIRNIELASVKPYYKNRRGTAPFGDNYKIKNSNINNEIFMMEKFNNYINQFLLEMPNLYIDGGDKRAYFDDESGNKMALKDCTPEMLENNIVLFRVGEDNGFFAKGYSLIYFMETEDSAKELIKGNIPYKIVPKGAMNPIIDVWKNDRNGQKNILGLIEGNITEDLFYIDMISVRRIWQKNAIGKNMIKSVIRRYPNAKIETSSRTPVGKKFFDMLSKDEELKDKLGDNSEKIKLRTIH